MIVIGEAPQLLRNFGIATNVRFGSKADICGATSHVRFTPNSDRESGHAANGHVCFTPKSGHVAQIK
jgi:hypothetical protein